MAVPELERGEGKFTVLVEANNLLCYTLQICSNENNFDPKFQKVIMDDIISTTKDIFLYAYSANEIKVGRTDQAIKRLTLIESSVLECSRLLALLQTAKKLYHIDTKRIKYWGGKALSVKNMLIKWHNTEHKRYAEYL